ncbi:hypothetical protein BG005_000883, partial [Podila minutissima]
MPPSHAEIARGLLRPRFIIAFVALALLSYSTYTRLNMNNPQLKLEALDSCPIANRGNTVSGTIVTTKDRLLLSEKLYQQHASQRDTMLRQNSYGKP